MEILFAGIILFICSFIQTIAGFAFSLFAVPLLLLCGYDLPSAVAMSVAGSIVQRFLVVIKFRESVEWKPLLKMCPMSLIGLTLGIVVLKKASMLDPEVIKQIFGLIILFAVGLRLFARVEPRDSVPFYIGGVAAFFSGLLNGFANIGGPPLVLWILAHKWPKNRLRVTIPAFTIMMVPIQIILLGISFGIPVLVRIGQGLLFFPVILIAVFMGNICSHKLSTTKIRLIIIILLSITGLTYIIYPIIKKCLE
jgi:uncharacterized membrane protein YfcA